MSIHSQERALSSLRRQLKLAALNGHSLAFKHFQGWSDTSQPMCFPMSKEGLCKYLFLPCSMCKTCRSHPCKCSAKWHKLMQDPALGFGMLQSILSASVLQRVELNLLNSVNTTQILLTMCLSSLIRPNVYFQLFFHKNFSKEFHNPLIQKEVLACLHFFTWDFFCFLSLQAEIQQVGRTPSKIPSINKVLIPIATLFIGDQRYQLCISASF